MKKVSGMILALLMLVLLCGCAQEKAVRQTGGELTVYFLDVGQADAAVLLCDGAVMMIDGGNSADSDFIYAWLKQHDIDNIDTMVCTHAHEDHVGGLSGALNYASVDAAYAPVQEAQTRVFENFVYYLDQQEVSITVPEAGDTFDLGGAQVEILGPVEEYSDTNDTSLVLRVTYGQTSFLFTGDMETTAEEDLLDAYWDLSANVLKVAHHGSDTSSGMEFLQAVDPDYAVISVGADNDYGHPSPEVLERLESLGLPVYRTDELGIICCVSDGETVRFSFEKNTPSRPDAAPEPAPVPEQEEPETYIGNRNTKKFHRVYCSRLPDAENQVMLDSYQAAIDAGYEPCGICKP